MLEKKYRLPIQLFFRQSAQKTKPGRYFLYKYFAKEKPYPRFGVAVGKKISAAASRRNELRRLVYRTIHENNSCLNQDYDVLLIALRKIESDTEKHAMIDELVKNLCFKQSS